jgi:hypothetical protein
MRLMALSLTDIRLLKELKAAGETGRTIRAYSTRLSLDHLAEHGYVVARSTGPEIRERFFGGSHCNCKGFH